MVIRGCEIAQHPSYASRVCRVWCDSFCPDRGVDQEKSERGMQFFLGLLGWFGGLNEKVAQVQG